jgi:outer membrane protein assembly factor BamB
MKSPRCRPSRLLVIGIIALLACFATAMRAEDVLTQRYDNARTGANLRETLLTTAKVSSAAFGKLWTLYADGQISAQPLYVPQLAIDTSGNTNTPLVRGTFNAVIIATMHNTVYVYDADKENRGPDGRTIPLWATWLGPPRPGSKAIDMWSTNDPEWGILSTPVVSDDKKTLFVVAWHDDGQQGLRFRLHALDLQKGIHRLPPVAVGPSSVDPSQPCREQSPFNPCVHKQRAALLLSQGTVYLGFGGDGNRGALYAFDAQTLALRAVWSPTPTGDDGGIWQSGQGPAADADGNVYLMTANGTFDAQGGGQNFGNSFVKLKLEGQTLVVKDFFTPCNFAFLNAMDLDLGSGGPVLIPDTPARIVSGGKEGVLYVLSAANMGKFAASVSAPNCQNANAVQQVNAFASQVHNNQTHWGNIHGSPVFWKGPDGGRVYAWGENSPLKAFLYNQGRLQDVNNPKQSAFRPPDGMPGGMLAVSANGNRRGTGIVWAVVPLDGDANTQRGVKGIVLALDAQDVSRTLWTSEQFAQRDRLGLFAKFSPPVIADGKVFVATYGDDEPRRSYPQNGGHPTAFPKNYFVVVYGLLTTPAPPRPVVNQNRDDVTVVRATATMPLALDTGRCTTIDAGSIDCTDALAEMAGIPSLHRVVLASGQGVSECALLRVTTASKDSGFANSSGIGFWSAEAADGNQAAENSGRFLPRDRLKTVGAATFLNGAAATLHEFAGVANCPVGGSTSLSRLFKPYMQFEDAPDGTIYRNWDLAANYRISRTITQFDRSQDVLRR